MSNLDRALGCWFGQLSGDALGSFVEFRTKDDIQGSYPNKITKLADGGTWNTLAGQPTDDSEMAITLANSIIQNSLYNVQDVKQGYIDWLNSKPFDYGATIQKGLTGLPSTTSQANGAMMRASPLGIYGSTKEASLIIKIAEEDAKITHPNPICVELNILYVLAISYAIKTGCSNIELYGKIKSFARSEQVINVINTAKHMKPIMDTSQQGWVCIAFQNALWQLLYAESFEHGVIDTVMQGGDTDTNAAISGALLGSVYGIKSVPKQWVDKVSNCSPKYGETNVFQPRPEKYWSCGGYSLVNKLLSL